jgi:hypothetical protein
MESIYFEALLFVLVFGGMSILSILISRRQAKAYEAKIAEEEQNEKREETKPLNETKQRIEVLFKLVKSGILTNEEFQILKESKTTKTP